MTTTKEGYEYMWWSWKPYGTHNNIVIYDKNTGLFSNPGSKIRAGLLYNEKFDKLTPLTKLEILFYVP
jgi:hypothetical protein